MTNISKEYIQAPFFFQGLLADASNSIFIGCVCPDCGDLVYYTDKWLAKPELALVDLDVRVRRLNRLLKVRQILWSEIHKIKMLSAWMGVLE
jgi:hypothetical protein